MQDLLKLLQIYGVAFLAQIMFNFYNFTFLFSRLKFGVKTGFFSIPVILIDKTFTFGNWKTLTLGAWFLGAIVYIPAFLLMAWSYVLSIRYFDNLTSAIIVSTIASMTTSIFFAHLRAGEVLSRNGWIAILLLVIASFFAPYAGRNV